MQTADSAQVAKEYLLETKFDLVVTDLSLEQPLSGFEIARFANLQPLKPTIVAISGFQGRLSAWKDNGADAGLAKPTDVRELLHTVNRLWLIESQETATPDTLPKGFQVIERGQLRGSGVCR